VIGKVIQPTRGKKVVTTSSMMTSRCERVLCDLDPVHALADRARHADAEQHRAGGALALDPVAATRLIERKQRAAVAARREQDATRRIEHGVGVKPRSRPNISGWISDGMSSVTLPSGCGRRKLAMVAA